MDRPRRGMPRLGFAGSLGESRKYDPSHGGRFRLRPARMPRRSAEPADESKAVVVGETVLGRFKLVERIGAGGFGTVYRGRDERLERPVAVKVIEARGHAGRRVLREAQAAARL